MTDRYVQAVKSHGKWRVLQKYGPGVLGYAAPSRGLMTKAEADELARLVVKQDATYTYLRPEGTR